MEKKGPVFTSKVTKSPKMGCTELSKSPDGGAIEKNKPSHASSKAEGQDKGGMSGGMSVKSSFGKVNTY